MEGLDSKARIYENTLRFLRRKKKKELSAEVLLKQCLFPSGALLIDLSLAAKEQGTPSVL